MREKLTLWARSLTPGVRLLLLLLAAGAAVRLFASLSFSTTAFTWADSLRFIRVNPWSPDTGMFEDPWMPAGYPLFLRGLQQVSDALWIPVALQHLAGLGVAVALFASVRLAGAPTWAALIPAGLVALSGDMIFMEHSIMNEALTLALLVGGLLLTVAGARSARPVPLLLGAGALLGLAATVRSTALVAAVAAAAWLALVGLQAHVAWAQRLRNAAALGLAAIVVVGGCSALASASGSYTGFGNLSGWLLYGRAAPFADCREFTPEPDLRVLCEDTPPEQRNGPVFYVNAAEGPGRQHFDLVAGSCALAEQRTSCGTEQDRVAAFARAAIWNQPFDYARATLKDLVRYVDPEVGVDRPHWGSTPIQNSFEYTAPEYERVHADGFRERYSGIDTSAPGRQALATYQRIFHMPGLLLLVLLATTIAGLALGRGPARRAAALYAAVAALLYLAPVMTFSYDYRYGMVPQPLLATAAALGVWALVVRRRGEPLPGWTAPEREPILAR